MLKRCIAAENRKLHRSPIWLLFFVMPLISASYGTFNYLQNLEILHEIVIYTLLAALQRPFLV